MRFIVYGRLIRFVITFPRRPLLPRLPQQRLLLRLPPLSPLPMQSPCVFIHIFVVDVSCSSCAIFTLQTEETKKEERPKSPSLLAKLLAPFKNGEKKAEKKVKEKTHHKKTEKKEEVSHLLFSEMPWH